MISEGLQIYLTDNVQSWEMDGNGRYHLRRASRKSPRNAQRELIELLKRIHAYKNISGYAVLHFFAGNIVADVFLIGEDLFDVTLMSCNRNRLPLSSDGLCNTR